MNVKSCYSLDSKSTHYIIPGNCSLKRPDAISTPTQVAQLFFNTTSGERIVELTTTHKSEKKICDLLRNISLLNPDERENLYHNLNDLQRLSVYLLDYWAVMETVISLGCSCSNEELNRFFHAIQSKIKRLGKCNSYDQEKQVKAYQDGVHYIYYSSDTEILTDSKIKALPDTYRRAFKRALQDGHHPQHAVCTKAIAQAVAGFKGTSFELPTNIHSADVLSTLQQPLNVQEFIDKRSFKKELIERCIKENTWFPLKSKIGVIIAAAGCYLLGRKLS